MRFLPASRVGALMRLGVALEAALVVVGALTPAHRAGAEITSGPDVIRAPASVAASSAAGGASNDHQQAFNERQVVVLPVGLAVDGGRVIPAGAPVSSHMIFLHQKDCGPLPPCRAILDPDRTWTFSHPILGVMSDINGLGEAASNALLGTPGTFYPGALGGRGLEPGSADTYVVVRNVIIVTMEVAQPGDWIRVVTEAAAEDCQHDGLRSSGQWKSQDECVSWFATFGRKPGPNVPTPPGR